MVLCSINVLQAEKHSQDKHIVEDLLPHSIQHARLLHVLPCNVLVILHISKGPPDHAVALKT
jgi:hypothetical protein